MLDHEFLRAEKPSLRQVVTYVTRSGYWRRPVIARVLGLFTEKGAQVRSAEPERLVSSVWESSLFGDSAVVLDVAAIGESKEFLAGWDKLMASLSDPSELENRLLIVVPAGSKAVEHEGWAALAKASTQIEEAFVTQGAVPKLVEAFKAKTDLYDFSKLLNPADFDKAFDGVASKAETTIVDVARHFDFVTLTCLDPEANTFDLMRYRMQLAPKEEQAYFYATHKLIFEFLSNPKPEGFTGLAREIDHRVHKLLEDPRMVMGLLHRATRDLIGINAGFNPNAKGAPDGWSEYKAREMDKFKALDPRRLMYWHGCLCEIEPAFIKGNPTIAMVQLGRNVLRYLFAKDDGQAVQITVHARGKAPA